MADPWAELDAKYLGAAGAPKGADPFAELDQRYGAAPEQVKKEDNRGTEMVGKLALAGAAPVMLGGAGLAAPVMALLHGDTPGYIAEKGPGVALEMVKDAASSGATYALPGGAMLDPISNGIAKQVIRSHMPGEPDQSFRDAVKEGAFKGTVDLAANAIGEGGGFVARRIVQALSPAARLATKAAAEGGGEAVGSLSGQTVDSFTKKALDLQAQVSKDIGEKFTLDAAQATGSPSALMAKRTLEQMPETMDLMARDEQRRLIQTSKFLDKSIERVAADPAKLGNSEVGKSVADSLERYTKSLVDARRVAAGPLFDEADRLSKGAKIVPTDNARAAIKGILEELRFAPESETAGLRAALGKIDEYASKTGRIGVNDAQQLLSYWGQLRHGGGTVLENIPRAQQRRVASLVLGGIEADLDAASKGASGPAIDALTAARTMWREHSRAIDEAGTEAVQKILKLNLKGDASKIPAALMRASPEQIGSIAKILDETAPDAAKQLRANTMRNLFEAAGKSPAESPFGAEMRGSTFQPGKMLRIVDNNYAQLKAVLGGDSAAAGKMKAALELADRLSMGPGIRGSDTAPKQMFAAVLRGTTLPSGSGVGGRASEMVAKAIERRVFSPAKIYQLISSPEGVDAFYKLTAAAANDSAPGQAGTAAATQALARIVQLTDERPAPGTTVPATVDPMPGEDIAGLR